MRVQSLEFHGYGSGQVDFGARYNAYAVGDPSRIELDMAVNRIAGIVDAGAAGDSFVALAIVGYSDRNDAPGLDCNARRMSESSASLDRAQSAWLWLQGAVASQLAIPLPDWPDASDRVTWINVPTGATLLAHDPPAGDADRAENRRVKFVFSFFGPAGW